MITGKQRSYLKSLAHHINPVVYIGKGDITEKIVSEIDRYLAVHELIKVKIQDSCLISAKEAAESLACELDAEFVQAIGNKFSLYRKAKDPEKRTIVLPK